MTQKALLKSYKPARQARSKRTEQSFIDAAERVFAEYGFSGARIADIIVESKCSTGSFYHRFSDKRDLFEVMLNRMIEVLSEDAELMDLTKETHGNLESLLSHYARRCYLVVQENMGFYRAVHEISTRDPEVWDRLKTITIKVGDRFASIADEYAEEIGKADKPQAMKYAVQTILTMTIHTSLGSGALFPKDQEQLSRIIVEAALGVLR